MRTFAMDGEDDPDGVLVNRDLPRTPTTGL
jgi:hypothetical protein